MNQMPIGSHIPIKAGKSYRQLEAERRDSRECVQDRQVSPQLGTGN